jgi:hypothetical protein
MIREIRVETFDFDSLSEESKLKARECLQEKYGEMHMDTMYDYARENLCDIAEGLGLHGFECSPGLRSMNFDIDDRPYGDASEGDDLEIDVEEMARKYFMSQVVPDDLENLIEACRVLAKFSNDINSYEGAMDNARLVIIRELARVYYKNIEMEEDYLHSEDWAKSEAYNHAVVFDIDGNDITYLLEKYLEKRSVHQIFQKEG